MTMVDTTATQTLASKSAKGSKPLTYGSTVTLMNPYNEYVLVEKDGDMRLGGFLNGNNNVKIISPAGKKGAVKFGDDVSLMGANGKYFLVRYSGKVAAHASVIARDTKFKVVGGSGDVHIADRVSFKSEFGYLRASDDGCRSVETLTAGEKFLVGLPGQENGLKQANGLHYGEVVTFENMDDQDCSPCTQRPHGVRAPRQQCPRGCFHVDQRPKRVYSRWFCGLRLGHRARP